MDEIRGEYFAEMVKQKSVHLTSFVITYSSKNKGGQWMFSRFGKTKKTLIVTVSLLFTLQTGLSTALAGDTLPYTGDSATGLNQPTQHGYTANDILEWTPEADKNAEMLRSRVPLQERNQAFSATQANPNVSSETQMLNLAGDYGNAFMDSTAYTNKFGQYTFPYWQYIDYYSYWHGTASADVPNYLYNPSLPWYERWFEFGVLNIPNPAYTNAAHKNGVKSLAVIFFSSNDRGPQTYTQMLVKDKKGNFPVAEKLIEMAQYYGYDGYFFNQEEASSGVAVKDIPVYKEFLKVLRDKGLYVQWYDSVHNTTGKTRYENEFTAVNSPFVKDEQYGDLANSIFLNYLWNKQKMVNSKAHAESLGLDSLKTVFAGIEAGGDRFNKQRNDLRNNLDSNGKPLNSIAMLGSDFTHHGLDEDLGGEDTNRRNDSEYQWMSFIRDRAWWSGPNLDPTKTGRNANAQLSDVAAKGDNWDGVAAYIAERSVIQGANFVSDFNMGRGQAYYVNGKVSNAEEWSNINIQDIPVTWQWWLETTGTPLQADFDFGPEYNAGSRYSYEKVGAFNGGSSLVVNGALDADNFLHLYKTDLQVKQGSEFSLTYNKTSPDDSSEMSVGFIFKDNPDKVVKVKVPDSGKKTAGWVTAKLDLADFAGKEIASFGIHFANGDKKIDDYQMNIGQVKISDGSIKKPQAPTGLKITKALRDSNEMNISWDMEAYDNVKQYNVYNNGVYVGGIYDEVFYLKNLQSLSGEITLTAVSQDGQESDPAAVHYDLTKGVSNIKTVQSDNGDMVVSWKNPMDIDGKISINIATEYDYAKKVNETVTVKNGKTEVKLPDMPINGDKYLIKIKVGSNDWISYRGTFFDKSIEAYSAEKVTIEGNSVTWGLPESRDWHYLYVYENGEAKTFDTTYSQGHKPYIVRGRTHTKELTFETEATDSSLEFVLEDYSGNKASTVIRTTLDNLYSMINDLVESGELNNKSGEQLTKTLTAAKKHYDGGRLKQAATSLNKFKDELNDKEMKNVSEDTKNRLKANADYFLRNWKK